jgi:hypothetical protein
VLSCNILILTGNILNILAIVHNFSERSKCIILIFIHIRKIKHITMPAENEKSHCQILDAHANKINHFQSCSQNYYVNIVKLYYMKFALNSLSDISIHALLSLSPLCESNFDNGRTRRCQIPANWRPLAGGWLAGWSTESEHGRPAGSTQATAGTRGRSPF